jgi:quinol monooxygenase YgiN
MKRPIAEFWTLTIQPDAAAEWLQHAHEAWEILRRKQGYVIHRLYGGIQEPQQRLLYSEWESKKALDGARQYLQSTPLMRRARSALTAPPQRLVVELVGPITSTKGLALPADAIAVRATTRFSGDAATWRLEEEQLWKALAAHPAHLSHVLFRGFDDASVAGAFSHWVDATAVETARVEMDQLTGMGDVAPRAAGWEYALYAIIERPAAAVSRYVSRSEPASAAIRGQSAVKR